MSDGRLLSAGIRGPCGWPAGTASPPGGLGHDPRQTRGTEPSRPGPVLVGGGGLPHPCSAPSGAGPHLPGPPAWPCLRAACPSAQVFGIGTDVGIAAPHPARSAQPGTGSSDGGQPQGAPVSEARPGPWPWAGPWWVGLLADPARA